MRSDRAVAGGGVTVPTVRSAAAAAILSTKHLSADERQALNDSRYYVHPHVEKVDSDNPALAVYLKDIYDDTRKGSVEAAAPGAAAFTALENSTSRNIVRTARTLADALRGAMESKSASPGILFAFTLTLGTGAEGYGIIKADLQDEQRFYMNVDGSKWSLAAVQELLPPPQTKFAKYAISPQPRGRGALGIRDTQADPNQAADYFLDVIGVQVPRLTGTKGAIAQAAQRSGYDPQTIVRELGQISTDEPLDTVIDRSFPEISDSERTRLRGTTQRPLTHVVARNPLIRTFSTKSPTFELKVDESVDVVVNGDTITVKLPADHDDIQRKYS